MPYLSKRTLSQYIRRGCQRQLRLYLSPENEDYRHEREAQAMPDAHNPRPGLQHIREAGREWETEKVKELADALGQEAIVGNPEVDDAGQTRYKPIDLAETIPHAEPGVFLAEAQFPIVDLFIEENGLEDLDLHYGAIRPDLIEVLEPGVEHNLVTSDGRSLPADDDERIPLRVIDIKLTAEPSPAYFAEVAYYSMALAAWLEENGLSDRFRVSSRIAVWPGSHEGSGLVAAARRAQQDGREPTLAELRTGLADDLEEGPFTVFSSRLRTFFEEELPEVLETPWDGLPWHVDHRCIGCEYLGDRWVQNPDPRHCFPTAEAQGHLSRVPDISRGARESLSVQGVGDVESLADRDPDDPVFQEHHTLRAKRTVFSGRASALIGGEPGIPDLAGTSAVMPRWADLRIHLTVDFDVGSGLTLAFGLKGFWYEPWQGQGVDRDHRHWDSEVFVVDTKEVDVERRELLRFLERIHEILRWAEERDPDTTVQFYIWDRVQYDHLTRVLGRHLLDILHAGGIDYLAWLFPPEDVLDNPDYATRDSPITVVSEVIRSVLAVPIPHVYTLLTVARKYHPDRLPEQVAKFSVHPHFEDDFSSQVPSERAHEIWSRVGGKHPWAEQLTILIETIKKRVRALDAVTERLENDLRDELGSTAPNIDIGPPEREHRIGWDGQLWLGHARLDAALEDLEIDSVRAMPPHEREARFRSALLSDRLDDEERRMALTDLGLDPAPDLIVYQMEDGSSEVKVREGEFTWCLAPDQDTSVLDTNLYRFLRDHDVYDQVPLPDIPWGPRDQIEDLTQVTVEAINRQKGLIALSANTNYAQTVQRLEALGVLDLSTNVSLEPVFIDFFTSKLRRTLRAIGNPEIQRDDPLVRRAIGREFARRGNRTAHTPVADVLWDPTALSNQEVERNLTGARAALEEIGHTLNDSQWRAWEESLSHRLSLIWGPPGTGKSRTARAAILAAVWDAHSRDDPLRVLVTAPTYKAMDTVLEGVWSNLPDLVGEDEISLHRVRSHYREPPTGTLAVVDTPLDRNNITERVQEIRDRLDNRGGITVVGALPGQVHNLLRTWGSDVGQRELFDLIVVDEASQLDVAHAVLSYAPLADGGSLIVAGDPLQLDPIQEADPPLDLESLVGSTYHFFQDLHEIPQEELLRNYRSNREIVEFQRQAGYPVDLEAHSPDLRPVYFPEPGREAPADWPEHLPWGDFVSKILDSDRPCICVTYNGGLDSQWNSFEARIVTSLVRTLKDCLGDQLLNERDGATGEPLDPPEGPYAWPEFWDRGVGIVTPHKAQQALIIDQLQEHCGGPQEGAAIRSAVDTVERFQGQQRDVIIASYAVSDPDMIRDEDEFLQGLHRFNVLQSRARAKVVIVLSEELVRHLSSDLDVLRESGLLKDYATLFCDAQDLVDVPSPAEGEAEPVAIRFHLQEDQEVGPPGDGPD